MNAPAAVAAAWFLSKAPKWALPVINVLAAFILLYALFFNQPKPLALQFYPVDAWNYDVERRNIWQETGWGKDRFYYADHHFGDHRVANFAKIVPPGVKVGLRVMDESWIYPFLLRRPDVDFVPLNYAVINAPRQTLPDKLKNLDYLLCLDLDCRAEIGSTPVEMMWRADETSGARPGALFKLTP